MSSVDFVDAANISNWLQLFRKIDKINRHTIEWVIIIITVKKKFRLKYVLNTLKFIYFKNMESAFVYLSLCALFSVIYHFARHSLCGLFWLNASHNSSPINPIDSQISCSLLPSIRVPPLWQIEN